MNVVVAMRVCWRLKPARTRSSPVTQGKSQLSPDPSKIALYVSSGFLPVVTRTTSPPMTNAMNTVSSGARMPPARCASAIRAAKLSGGSSGAVGVCP